MEKHRLGLIGCGSMAKTHVGRFEACRDRMEVTALVDIVPERAKALSELLPNHPPIFTDYHTALPYCDVVLQALPHHLHAACTVDCLNAGKHVLCEKPLANSETDCRRMIAAAERNHRILMVAYCMRFHPLLVEMKRLLDEEVYGKCFQLSIWTEQYTDLSRGDWLGDEKLLGGGQLFSHGCHYIDLLLWMLGEPLEGAHIGTKLGAEWVAREGSSNVTIKFASGAMGYHFGTWGARGTKHGYNFQAHCTKGMLEADITHGALWIHSNLKDHVPGEPEECRSKELLNAPKAKPTVQELLHFLDCVETGKTPLTNAPDSLAGLQVIWELYRAEDEHRLANLRGLWPVKEA